MKVALALLSLQKNFLDELTSCRMFVFLRFFRDE